MLANCATQIVLYTVQPYTQTKLTLYQIETVSIPILDANDKAQSYTQLQVRNLTLQ